MSRAASWARFCALGILAVVAALQASSVSSQATAQTFDLEAFTLDNGLQVVVIPNHRAPIVQHMVWYKVGAADEPTGKSGIAHFLEHLMFKGTETKAPGEFRELIARIGGRHNAFTSSDYTAYFQNVARDRLEIVMTHEADRMANLVLSDEEVLPEREVILEERRSRIDNAPQAQLTEMIEAALYMNHPYQRPVIGWEHEMRGLTTEDAMAFYRLWYAPNNAILIVAGDITAEALRPMAEATYGRVPARAVPLRARPLEPKQNAPRRVVLEDARVRQPAVAIHYLAPSFNARERDQAYALQVLNAILGGGPTSRLKRTLAVEQALAARVGSWYRPDSLDSTTFGFYASPRPGVDLALVERALRAQIRRLCDYGVNEAEVAAAKRRLKTSRIYARDQLGTVPRVIGRALTTGRSLVDIQSWPERIEAVTVEQINRVARQVFEPRNSVTGLLVGEAPDQADAPG